MKLENIAYISFDYILSRDYVNQKSITDENYSYVSSHVNKTNIENEKLIILDFEEISLNHFHTTEYSKKTPIYAALKDFIENQKHREILFLNAFKSILDVIMDEFKGHSNISVLSINVDGTKIFWSSKGYDESSYLQKISKIIEQQLDTFNLFNRKEEFLQLKFSLVSSSIRKMLLKKSIIEFEKEDIAQHDLTKDKHRLKSTPVHVNKYINIKPLLEDYDTFHEICYWISEKIKSLGIYPKYLVAGSKNALAIASGVNLFLKSDILVIHQVSPITSLSNFSNLDRDIEANSIFAIMEDFHCMGTEIKVLKGILWSKKIDVYNHVYSFPISSTRIYDDLGFYENKIFPLHKINDDLDYYIFTLTSCPLCNDIKDCYHRNKFKI